MYGAPGILLMFHVAMGQGGNVLTDGFAVAYAIKERFPDKWELLTTIGLENGRRLQYYEAGDLHFSNRPPIIQLDDVGNIIRIQFHEIYRASTQAIHNIALGFS